MSVYMIIEIRVMNEPLYARYVGRVHEVVTRHGGKYLVRGGNVTPVSGDWNPERLILIEFESLERLQACFKSPEYLELAPMRQQSTISRAIIAEGYVPDSAAPAR